MPILPPCKICGEKASGFHYGLNTCEACKAFFRRSLSKFDSYECADEKACVILPGKRSSCAYCRFQKCLALGMCKDAIKTGRYTHERRTRNIREVKGITEVDQDAMELSKSVAVVSPLSHVPEIDCNSSVAGLAYCDSEFSFETKELFGTPEEISCDIDNIDYEDIVNRITTIFRERYPLSDEFYDKLPAKEEEFLQLKALKTELFGPMKAVSHEEYTLFFNQTGIDIDGRRELFESQALPQIEYSIKQYIAFAKSIPGFNDLCVDDQIALVKTSRFDFWMMSSHRSFNTERSLYATPRGNIISAEDMWKLKDRDTIEAVFSLQKRIKALGMTVEETAVISAFVVMFCDHCQLRNSEIVERSQEQLLQCINYLFQKYHPEEKIRFARVINCLLSMRSVRENHRKMEERLANEWVGVVRFPPLLYEIWTS